MIHMKLSKQTLILILLYCYYYELVFFSRTYYVLNIISYLILTEAVRRSVNCPRPTLLVTIEIESPT